MNGVTAFAYDPNGNLLTVTDAKNQTTTYTYDNMDRLATRKDALNRTETYAYDLAGNLTTFTDRKGQVTTFQYDALNRRTQATYVDATTTFTYDAVGRLVKASDTAPGAGTIDFAYDILDRLIQETTPQGTVAYQYDVLGRRTQMVANGLQPTTYQYDSASRLTRVSQGSLFAALGYDNANRRTRLSYPNGTMTSYAYDLASRLTGITQSGPSGIIEALTYQYDAAGNRTSLLRANGTASLVPNAVASASYDAANEQISFAGANLTYDANGNLTSDGLNSYHWDARNRLIGISGGSSAAFAYDPLGRRSSKTINGVSMQFLYDAHDIAAEIGGGGLGAIYLRNLKMDEMFAFLRWDGSYFSVYDGLSSTLVLTDQLGSPVVQYAYEPFGKTQNSDPAFTNAIQFAGRENDNTGLYYYRARYYSPVRQRFISQDPVGIAGGGNFYRYARNNPMRYTDPRGLFTGRNHRKIAKRALKAEGCSADFANKVAQADVDADHDPDLPTFDPNNAHYHGQQGPNDPTIAHAMAASNARVQQQLALNTESGLGNAMHSTEDPFSRSHQWTPALPEPSISDPKNWKDWLEHYIADEFPSDEEIARAVEADRQLIQQWLKMHGRKACP
jgi:RHS repeat-associated protein